MNANVMKSNLSFYTSSVLKRNPANKENKGICDFIDGHEFSFRIDNGSKELRCVVTPKKRELAIKGNI